VAARKQISDDFEAVFWPYAAVAAKAMASRRVTIGAV
jgi:hypothetical protein